MLGLRWKKDTAEYLNFLNGIMGVNFQEVGQFSALHMLVKINCNGVNSILKKDFQVDLFKWERRSQGRFCAALSEIKHE